MSVRASDRSSAESHPIIPQKPVVPVLSPTTQRLVSREFFDHKGCSGKFLELTQLSERARSIQELGANPNNLTANKTNALLLCLGTAVIVSTTAALIFPHISALGLTALIISSVILGALHLSTIVATALYTASAWNRSSPEQLNEEWVHTYKEKQALGQSYDGEIQEMLAELNRRKSFLSQAMMNGSSSLIRHRLEKMQTAQHEIQAVWNWVRA